MMKKIIMVILVVILYLIFRDKKKSKQKAYDILGSPKTKNRPPGTQKEIIDVDFIEVKKENNDE
ncbi:MAG: hypothetical protein Kow00108_27360 [Calditrichia bacterium]